MVRWPDGRWIVGKLVSRAYRPSDHPTIRPSLVVAVLALAACARSGSPATTGGITAEEIVRHVQVLGSDSFAGRAPSSPGEEKTVSYLRDQFVAIGLQPGNGESFFQEVPLVAIEGRPQGTLAINGRRQTSGSRFVYKNEFVAWTRRVVDQSAVSNSPVVFVGFGVVAPEYQWNDYAGVDVRGKTVIILVNDPGYDGQDTTLFHGRTMTYYGRWTYKFEEAARQGAAGAFIVHETAGAGYGWDVVQNGFTGPQFSLVSSDQNMSRIPVEGWITSATARSVFRQAGYNLDTLKARAGRRGFKAVPFDLRASVAIRNTIRRSTSRNVLGMVPGGARKDAVVIYAAHWDHFGTDSSLKGDQIMNGARDNASGVAGLLVLARAFTKLPQPPARSVLFLMLTGEEQGLLGSQYYATHPVYPLDRTAAVINVDELNIFGRTRDITLIGLGNSALDDYIIAAAKEQGRVVRPDPQPEKGYFYRSDHFSFAKQGVPALNPNPGIDNVAHGEAWGKEREERWIAEKYHKPSDQYDASWDLSGAVEDLDLLFAVGTRIANDTTWPNWRPGTEFRAKRDSMMK
ncbi:MAG: M28 family peptidase [Gemmatimonadetes bacterium]|nr:M28 family peptidase [Gemmatimonadota bacterium]